MAEKRWPLNCWYVAAHSSDITEALFARTILNQAVIVWRDASGAVSALEDRCPHRLVPLSTGEVVNGQVQCGYHGLRFDGTGTCSYVPGQETPPKSVRVRTFPVAERHNLIWIWMGAAELADTALIPDMHWMGAPDWNSVTGYLHFECNYKLVNDNLLDLSHETFIHKHTIGADAVADSPAVTDIVDDRVVRVHREMPDIEPPPFFALAQGHEGRINRWQIAIYMAPGFNMTEAAFHGVGTDRRTDHFIFRPIHIVTPETDSTSHYIWSVARNFRIDEEDLDEGILKATDHTFKEDRELLRLQQKALEAENFPPVPLLPIKVDKGPVTGRRLLEAMIEREAADPAYCAPPALLADDATITMPFAEAAE